MEARCKAFRLVAASAFSASWSPITAKTGKQNSSITWMDDTARNLLYKGTMEMNKRVSDSKFFPQDKNSESSTPAISHFLYRSSGKHKAKTARKTTTIPT